MLCFFLLDHTHELLAYPILAWGLLLFGLKWPTLLLT
jgi:hypothetical protein